MWGWLQRWFGGRRGGPEATAFVAQELELQTLRLELHEREQTIAALKEEFERLRRGQSERLTESVHTRLARLFGDMAASVVQLNTQLHLLEQEAKPVEARHLGAVVRRLLGVLQEHGLVFHGGVGNTVRYDPVLHEPLGGSAAPGRGEEVVVRFVGLEFAGHAMRKAGVERRGA